MKLTDFTTMMRLFLLASWYAVADTVVGDTIACPFNNDCSCDVGDKKNWYFINVECPAPRAWPHFNGTSNFYKINLMRIIGNVSTIPANSFDTFRYITHLTLEHTTAREPLNWDPNAFKGLYLNGLATINVAGIIPLPQALAMEQLQDFSISRAGEGVYLGANCFEKLPKLGTLSISRTPILGIDELAFTGGTRYWLYELKLESASLSEIPFHALAPLDDLITLDLSGNRIKAINVTGVVVLPEQLDTLVLDKNDITTVPTELIARYPELRTLSLIGNKIHSVSGANFHHNATMGRVILDNNPLTDLDFTDWPDMLDELFMQRTTLSEIDLSDLSHTRMWRMDVSNTSTLKRLNLSGEAPGRFRYLILENTGLQLIDSGVERLYENSVAVKVNLKNNRRLICSEDMKWMAKFVFCRKKADAKLQIDGSVCENNGMLLADYLKGIVSDPCN